ncbi:MAG: hypothetical protein QMD09_10200, partial [Desulfatibacillaceae bacterium]|nr:hypothetical protein [Desulfatibacillaceae bacterium]
RVFMKVKGWNVFTMAFLAIAVAGLAFSGPALAQWSSDISQNMAVAKEIYTQSFPSIIHDGKGGYFVVWHDKRNCDTAGRDIYAQYYNSDGVAQWPANGLQVVGNAGGQKKPDVVLDGAGGIVVMWTDSNQGLIAAQRINAQGQKLWADEGVVAIDDDYDCVARGAADGSGGIIVVNNQGHINRIAGDGTLPWTPADEPIEIAGGNNTYGRQIISDGAGGAIVVWQDGDIAIQRIDANGQLLWGEENEIPTFAMGGRSPFYLTDTGCKTASCPRLIPDGAGGAIVIWLDDYYGGEDLYAQRVNAAGQAQWFAPNNGIGERQMGSAPGGILVHDGDVDYESHDLASDGQGGAFIRFGDWDSGGYKAYRGAEGDFPALMQSMSSLFIHRILADGTLAWEGPTGVDDDDYDFSDSPMPGKITSDGQGGAITVWATDDDEIRVQRVNAQGEIRWQDGGVVLRDNSSGEYAHCPKITSNGLGGAVAVWVDERDYYNTPLVNGNDFPQTSASYEEDIYMMAINAFGQVGNPGWVPPHVQEALATYFKDNMINCFVNSLK